MYHPMEEYQYTLYKDALIDEVKKDKESYSRDEEFFIKSNEKELVGVNFISLLKNPEFYDFYKKIDKSKLKFYTHYFEDYMFKGKSMFSFWANENNPLFLISFGISEGLKLTENKEEELNDTLV